MSGYYCCKGTCEGGKTSSSFHEIHTLRYAVESFVNYFSKTQVDAIQDCGGQMTADGKRSRTGGGVLWNILKAREPEAYKEIMAKGRELEVILYARELF